MTVGDHRIDDDVATLSRCDASLAETERIRTLLFDYGHCLDEDRLEDWPEFFAEHGTYRIVPRENLEAGLSFALIFLENRNQLRDRIHITRKALVYSPRHYLHTIGSIRVWRNEQGFAFIASYVVHATDVVEGTSKLFAVGRYDGTATTIANGPRLTRLDVILDTYSVDRQLPVPL